MGQVILGFIAGIGVLAIELGCLLLSVLADPDRRRAVPQGRPDAGASEPTRVETTGEMPKAA